MFKINYYQKEKLLRNFFLVLMFAFLIINSFPIFWMMFSSFKNNNDILSGKVGFSRAKNDVIGMEIAGKDLYAFSQDGGIAKYDVDSKRSIGGVKINGRDVNYYIDQDYIYLANSTKGLYKIDRRSLIVKAKASNPVTGVDTNRLGNTSIIAYDDLVVFTIELEGMNKIFIYDKKDLTLKRTVRLNTEHSSFIRSLYVDGDKLYIGTNKYILVFNKSTFIEEKRIDLGENYYPAGVQKIKQIKGNELILLVQNGLYFINLNKAEVERRKDYGVNLFEDILIEGEKLFIVSPTGLRIVNMNTEKLYLDSNNLVRELKDGVIVDPKSNYTSGEATNLIANGDELIIGSSYGRISFMKDLKAKPYYSLQLPLGHRLVMVENYADLWKNIDFGLYLRNSIIISGFTMLFAMILATLASYALVRFNFPGNKAFGVSILATQMIPQIMYLIPIFIMFKWISDVSGVSIQGTHGGLTFIYTAFFVPFSIWILRSFFASIPVELEESARVDGCNAFQVFWKITLPLAIPGIVATGIYIFLQAWDELMFAWILTDSDTLTIPIGIRLFVGNYQNRYDLMMAAATVATLPVLLLFFLLQKHIVKGLTAGAVKG
ncbi:MAG: carbohydrate ABC transporter permease [Candidatus Riflemargulisbacteria bacterium]